LVGTLLNWGLQGALFVQVYIYFLAFPKDKLFHKLVVVFIVVAEILQTLGDTKDAIRIFGDGYGNPDVLELVGWAWFSTPVAGSTIACVGQLFFAWRIFVLGNKLYIPALVTVVVQPLLEGIDYACSHSNRLRSSRPALGYGPAC
ncbi:hypothetical protein B0H19DRAFT_953308, partial [Mycena capillaripes]